jgi:hypothetical protein
MATEDELLAHAAEHGIASCTNLWLVEELLEAIADISPQLTVFTLVVRGVLKPPEIQDSVLMPRWLSNLQERWLPKGVNARIEIDGQAHTRQILLDGLGCTIDVRVEWGLTYYLEHPGNLALPAPERQVRRTDVLVLRRKVVATAGRHLPSEEKDGSTLESATPLACWAMAVLLCKCLCLALRGGHVPHSCAFEMTWQNSPDGTAARWNTTLPSRCSVSRLLWLGPTSSGPLLTGISMALPRPRQHHPRDRVDAVAGVGINCVLSKVMESRPSSGQVTTSWWTRARQQSG